MTGKHTEKQCYNLIESVTKNTGYDIRVYNGNNIILHDNVIDVTEITDVESQYVKVFNFNLKGIVMQHCYETTDYDKIIFCDSDIMITEKTQVFDVNYNDHDFYAKFERFNPTHKHNPTWKKYKRLMEVLGYPEENFFEGMTYANESFFICNRSERTENFLSTWRDICVKSSKGNINPASDRDWET